MVALNAHGDVVPPGEGWTKDPFGAEIVDGWMYGRGVAVSKSDFATYAFALLALEALGRGDARTARSSCTSPTTRRPAARSARAGCCEQGISKPDLALGAGFSYAVVTAHNGCLHLEVQVDGTSAHAAMPVHRRRRARGRDAHPVRALRLAQDAGASGVSAIAGIGSPQLTVGLIKGGINTNVVPDRVTFRLDRRMIPEERPADGRGRAARR